jgi:tRNA uridine 5-carbamoylmethylation protein Kti12
VRRKCLSLFFEYGAQVTIVYRECPRQRLLAQNRQRQAVVPDSVMEKLLRKWEVPSPTEAHSVQFEAS